MNTSIKRFLKIFFLIFILEIAIGVGHALLFQNNTTIFEIRISPITSVLIQYFSMPICFLNRNLPFYARETWLSIVLTILNIAIQTLIIVKLLEPWRSHKTNPKD